MAPTPYKIDVPESEIDLLRTKLSSTRFPDENTFTDNWNYGAPLSDIKRLVEYWQNGFDWRKEEAKLNEHPQFTTTVEIDGFEKLEVHFLHQKCKKAGSIPLLFCHGW